MTAKKTPAKTTPPAKAAPVEKHAAPTAAAKKAGAQPVLAKAQAKAAPAKTSPKAAANCQNLTRPNGSSAGRAALINSLTPGNAIQGCYDWSRSSSLNIAAVAAATGGLTYVPFAVDAFTYAVAKDSDIPRDLSLDDVKSIYRCEVPGIKPYIPQSGSGTRQYWLQQMGITEAQVTSTYTCIKDTKNGAITLCDPLKISMKTNSPDVVQ